MDAVLEQLRDAVARRAYVRVARDALGPFATDGFALAMGDDLLLMLQVRDFDPDGWAIVRLRDVTAVREGDNERFTARVLAAEGVDAALPEPPVDVSSWQAVFAALAAGPWPLVRVEGEEPEGDGDVWVGRVLRAGDESATFRYVSPRGRWDEPEAIPYDDVTLLTFGDGYTTVLARHVEPFPAESAEEARP